MGEQGINEPLDPKRVFTEGNYPKCPLCKGRLFWIDDYHDVKYKHYFRCVSCISCFVIQFRPTLRQIENPVFTKPTDKFSAFGAEFTREELELLSLGFKKSMQEDLMAELVRRGIKITDHLDDDKYRR